MFGINDGLVSNVSLILGFASAGVDAGYVRLAGIAGAVAGAISMAAGEWVSISSQNDLIRRELDLTPHICVWANHGSRGADLCCFQTHAAAGNPIFYPIC